MPVFYDFELDPPDRQPSVWEAVRFLALCGCVVGLVVFVGLVLLGLWSVRL